MAFFQGLHDPRRRNTLDSSTSNAAFERFYRDHIRKLLLISGRSRYAAKGNYNLSRLEYLLKLFPDARFVLPVRRPREQVASLIKQHWLFNAAARKHPRSVAHLDRVGHFEFGRHRACINVEGSAGLVESIESCWREGEHARGWARYWASLYRWLASRLACNPALRQATLLVRYEELCDDPERSIARLLAHCGLDDPSGGLARRWGGSIGRPGYYKAEFTADEERAIAQETDEVVAQVGY